MIIDFNRTVAYICPGCGETAFGEFSLFGFSGERGISVKCGCGKSQLKIVPKTKTQYAVLLPCIMCDETHVFHVPLNDFMRQECIDLSCPDILIGLAYIGKKSAVTAAVKENDAYLKEVVTACGLEHTGKNGITMLKALDKIQELSEDGNLTCECGSNMIDVDVLEDALILECCTCGAAATFTADEIRNGNFSDASEIVIKKSTESAKDKN